MELFLNRLLLITIIVTISVLVSPTAIVRAEPPPIDLELGGEGATPWVIDNIKPGDSGTKTLTLHNAGTLSGFVTIWFSDIVDLEGQNPPSSTSNITEHANLSQYLLLQLLSPRLGTNLAMPATLSQLPHSPDSTKYITISSLPPDDTMEMVWKWRLPTETPNKVQGARVFFAINYLLQEMPVEEAPGAGSPPETLAPPPSAVTLTILETVRPEEKTDIKFLSDGTLVESLALEALSGGVILSIDKGTKITTADGKVPQQIEIRTVADFPPLPEGMVLVSPLYDITTYIDKEARRVIFSQPLTLVLRYLPEKVPQNTQGLLMVYYDEEFGWTGLEPVGGLIAEEGQAAAMVSHFTKFAIVALVPPSKPATITPPIKPMSPPQFQLSNPEITPDRVNPGDRLTIRFQVTNTGGLRGEHVLALKINGLFIDSQVVNLAPGQNRWVSFVVTTRKTGSYQVEIDGLRSSFIVSETPAPLAGGGGVNRWLIMILTVLGGALIAGILILIFLGGKPGKPQLR